MRYVTMLILDGRISHLEYPGTSIHYWPVSQSAAAAAWLISGGGYTVNATKETKIFLIFKPHKLLFLA